MNIWIIRINLCLTVCAAVQPVVDESIDNSVSYMLAVTGTLNQVSIEFSTPAECRWFELLVSVQRAYGIEWHHRR